MPWASPRCWCHRPGNSLFQARPRLRTLLKSTIHRVSGTQCKLHDEGSCAIDENLLDATNIAENEQIRIWTINNGPR